ncbi:sugar phosphate nucleotidyltransferase, partial [Klebsiella pneumoniae]
MPQTIPIVPVILSGGSGTRLWPMSTPGMPKQMLSLTADETMLQLTARRAQGERFTAPIVVANE